MKKVFISYSSRDRADAFKIKSLLESYDCEVWLDFFDIQPTAQLREQLSGNIKQADVVCLMLSPTAVASKWVAEEIENALKQAERGLRLLPIILRPCSIPDSLNNIVGIDATDGIDNNVVDLRLVRAVCGEGTIEDGVLLDAGQRSILADKEKQLQADRDLPAVALEIARIRQEPIHEIRISIDHTSFPTDQQVILELQLELDTLWSQSMRFFFALYREGSTWPEEFGFQEPPYTHYFLRDCPHVDAKFRWFDRTQDLSQMVDGTDLHDLPAQFSLKFDGTEFRPTGINLPQKLQIPSLQDLIDKKSKFKLIAHYPESKTAQAIELDTTDIDIRVDAIFPQQIPSDYSLFRSTHNRLERGILGCSYLSTIESPIEREALLNHYSVPLEERIKQKEEKFSRIEQVLESEDFASDEERRLAAHLCYSRAILASFRTQHSVALQGFAKVSELMKPLIFEKPPTYEDIILMFRACSQIAAYLIQHEDFQRATGFAQNVGAVAYRSLKLDPSEPDYRRLFSMALMTNALVHAHNGDKVTAARELLDSVNIMRQLAADLPLTARLQAARTALLTGLKYASDWAVEPHLPVAQWRQELGLDSPDQAHVPSKDASKDTSLPVWLQPVTLDKWPTQPIENQMLRYSLRIRKGWFTTPQVRATNMEIEHIYRGSGPTDWLIVSCMDKANAESDMKLWVESVQLLSGFPVLAMSTELKPPPQLIEWRYEGTSPALATKLGVDESHRYSGMAKIPGEIPLLAHIYILMARRGNFAWKVTLSFASACLPGMPESMIASNDHVRAGATFGYLQFL